MDRLIIEHLPIVLREVPEIKALMAAEQPEIIALWTAQENVLKNQFLLSATELGVRRWERILKIYPRDTEGLEMRRARVLAILRVKLPYTVRWLRNWLDDLCGAGKYQLSITEYAIHLELGYDNIPEAGLLAPEIIAVLETVKPANMLLDYSARRESSGVLLIGGMSEMVAQIEIMPPSNILETGSEIVIAGYSECVLTLEIYPEMQGGYTYGKHI